MNEDMRRALMTVFQHGLTVFGAVLVARFNFTPGQVATWTQEATAAAPLLAGMAWNLANQSGFKVSDLFRKDTSKVDALEQRVGSLEEQVRAWMQSVEQAKVLESR